MVSLVNSHPNATSRRWHLWEIDFRFAPGLPPGWSRRLLESWRAREGPGIIDTAYQLNGFSQVISPTKSSTYYLSLLVIK